MSVESFLKRCEFWLADVEFLAIYFLVSCYLVLNYLVGEFSICG